ncbi:carbohydrate-binding module family 20 protein [Zasmidium cellare ATCC 36951]|uniref:alpha-amylase n=1 Tax=Zasmidium cellare ATCC 36951 TaxID=1080233 RepID=A0A6A6CH38_ZASCE|nr:carbohydrate-binding module family 20 protein [Zasmidium cellare ATCC 36951]KAF2166514.1 carbohydrate-binding module family 20 protein [Zasmidium cellare ATCC 36951]
MLSFALALLFGAAAGLTPAQWRCQSVYQVLTDRFALTSGSTTAACNWGSYCGGTWQGLINKLDYVKGMGFTAVWISPVVKNIAGGTPYGDPYHGYWPQDIYSLNSAFGTPADLKALSAALHSRGMYLMVDTVSNHFAYNGAPANVKWSNLEPFDDAKYYHPYCKMDHDNMTAVRECWVGDTVVSLPDLKTEDKTVQTMFNEWIPQLVQNYSIDGLRLDSAMQVNQDFWPSFISSSGVYAIGEVFDGNPNTFCTYQNYMPGMLNYAAYFWLLRAFQSTTATMSELANNLKWLNATCKDTTLLGNFLENHDNPRFASITNDTGLTKNAIAFTLLNDGLPIVYYGQEQGFSGATDPYNREPLWTSGYNTKAPMYTHIAKLNGARSLAISKDPTYVTSKSNVIYSDDKALVTSKGAVSSPLISVFTNLGAGKSSSIKINSKVTGFAANTKFTDLLTCTVISTDSSGNLAIDIADGAPSAFYLTSLLKGSDPCASTNTGGATSISSSSSKITCTTVSTVSVSFNHNVTTAWLESIKLIGSITELGKWNTSQAVAMSASGYTTDNPIWNATVKLVAGTYLEYKFIKVDSDGGVTWEVDPNRNYTVPRACSNTAVLESDWQ